MKKILRKIGKNIIYPPEILRIFLMGIGFASLIPAFITSLRDTAYVYVSYLFSFYALILAAAWLFCLILKLPRLEDTRIYDIGRVKQYFEDQYFHVFISLTAVLIFDLVYIAFKIYDAFLNMSVWTGVVAGYYLLLSSLRAYLVLRFLSLKDKNRQTEIKIYRHTSIFILAISLSLTFVVREVVLGSGTYSYPGYMIFVYAIYTFACFIISIYNMVKYRKYKSPLLSASKAVNLITALVSVFSLQTAMLNRYGDDDLMFQLKMSKLTGAAVCGSIFCISVFMLINSWKMVKREEAK